MLTAASLRAYTGASGVLDLLRVLGYPVAAVDVDPDEWRRGGVTVPWNGSTRLRLAARLQAFDLFVLQGDARNALHESVAQFLSSYKNYNQLTKSVLVYENDDQITIFDLSASGSLRRLDVDRHAPTAHALDRLNLLAHGNEQALPRIFDRALDREQVTRDFFHRFRRAVREVAGALSTALPDEPQDAVDAEALLLLSRLLFLSFIQEKGWLNGERRFLVDRLAAETAKGREFFSGVLMPLFFGCLNTPHEQRTDAVRRLGRIPYLNGGLFEPSPFERRHRKLHLPNALIARVIEDVFEKFDFRIDETATGSTHVDPEMLGKVFESLMAADERASSGSFYTPKEIVDVLTERAIRDWLGKGSREDLIARLERVTILDPACGSGAFLLSALGVLERTWRMLAPDRVTHDLRRRIVAQNLYGVDLKPEAVRLCELRLWLAIVASVDAPIERIEPLPNLDRNIMQGNSLLGPTDFLGNARSDLYAEWIYALRAQRELVERYRTASHAQRPALARIIRGNDQRLASEMLAKSVEAAEQELQRASVPQRDLFGRPLPIDTALCRSLHERVAREKAALARVEDGALDFFSYDVHFAPVMAAGGFDVVVGNPPWVRNSRIDAATKRLISDRYRLFRASGARDHFHQPDLSVAFVERAMSLASASGAVALLMPAKIVNAAYAAPLRRALRDHVFAISDWSDDPRRRRWFEADTFPLALLLRKSTTSADVRVLASGESFTMPRESLTTPGGEWPLVPPEVASILRGIQERHATLERALGRRPFMGVKTGDNRSFFLEVTHVRGDRLVTADGLQVPMSAACRCVRGRDVRRWAAAESQWMLWPPMKGWPKPPQWLETFAAARGLRPADVRLSFVRPEHVGIKVAWKDLSRGMAAVVLPDVVNVGGQPVPLIPNQTLYAVDAVSLGEAYVLAAILNSSVAGAWLVTLAERAKDAHFRYFGRTVAALPYPDVTPDSQVLERLARRAHQGIDVSREIDATVARVYGVTSGELRILQDFLARRLGHAGGASD